MNAVLTGHQGPRNQPIAYYCISLDNLEKGMPVGYCCLAAYTKALNGYYGSSHNTEYDLYTTCIA